MTGSFIPIIQFGPKRQLVPVSWFWKTGKKFPCLFFLFLISSFSERGCNAQGCIWGEGGEGMPSMVRAEQSEGMGGEGGVCRDEERALREEGDCVGSGLTPGANFPRPPGGLKVLT